MIRNKQWSDYIEGGMENTLPKLNQQLTGSEMKCEQRSVSLPNLLTLSERYHSTVEEILMAAVVHVVARYNGLSQFLYWRLVQGKKLLVGYQANNNFLDQLSEIEYWIDNTEKELFSQPVLELIKQQEKELLVIGTQREGVLSETDLSIFFDQIQGVVSWNYSSSRYDRSLMDAMHESLEYLLETLKTSDQGEVALAQWMTQLIEKANQSVQPAVRESLTEMIKNQIEKTPHHIAVIDKKGQYCYKQLKESVDRIALELKQASVFKNELIAIYSEKGYSQVCAVCAILAISGAYLPLNTSWPIGRIEEILDQAAVKEVLISKKMYQQHVRGQEIENRFRFHIIEEIEKKESGVIEWQLPNLHDTAYVIFTSGSTGKPKGVVISHLNAANTIVAVNHYFKVSSQDRAFAISELSFDLSVYDIFGMLSVGGALVFPDENQVKEVSHWVECIEKHQITLWNSVPQLVQLFVEYSEIVSKTLPSLRAVLMSGDWIPVKLPNQLKKVAPCTIAMSLGGATEGGIWSNWFLIEETKPEWTSIPYGVAMPNQTMYVLDSMRRHVPVGGRGEIYIGGEGVAQGYFQDPIRTAESFIEHATLGRVYKTGDAGKWSSAGYNEFDGRIDFQVKINGYRVELGEIEARLCEIETVVQGVVLALEDPYKNKTLCGYYEASEALEESLIKSFMRQTLPEYMVPKRFCHLSKLPLTMNGKVDRKALPNPFQESVVPLEVSEARSEQERAVLACYEKVLEVSRWSIDDDFYAQGGSSLKAIRLATLLQSLGLSVKVADIFTYKTVRSLMDFLGHEVGDLKAQFRTLYATLEHHQQLIKSDEYQEKLQAIKKSNVVVPLLGESGIKNIFLTGATGYLGIHLLEELLKKGHFVSVLVRASSYEVGWERLEQIYHYYFQEKLDSYWKQLTLYCGDLAMEQLGLDQESYQQLSMDAEIVIHSAANVGHYGHYEEFYQSNVLPVKYIVELATQGRKKSIHYLSTRSVVESLHQEGVEFALLHEESDLTSFHTHHNVYAQTKWQGEQIAILAREKGVEVSVYRLGNLVMNYKTGRHQKNIEENWFFQIVKSTLHLGRIPEGIEAMEMSCVNDTAQAILTLALHPELKNRCYHLYANEEVSLFNCLLPWKKELKKVDVKSFLRYLYLHFKSGPLSRYVRELMLHMGWLDIDLNKTHITRLNDETKEILTQLGFQWHAPTSDDFKTFVMAAYQQEINFFNTVALFKGVSFETIFTLARCCQYEEYRSETVLIKSKSLPTLLYIIHKGAVEISVENCFDKQSPIQLYGERGVVGAYHVLSREEAFFTAKTTETTSLYLFNAHHFLSLLASDTPLFINMNKLLEERQHTLSVKKEVIERLMKKVRYSQNLRDGGL